MVRIGGKICLAFGAFLREEGCLCFNLVEPVISPFVTSVSQNGAEIQYSTVLPSLTYLPEKSRCLFNNFEKKIPLQQ